MKTPQQHTLPDFRRSRSFLLRESTVLATVPMTLSGVYRSLQTPYRPSSLDPPSSSGVYLIARVTLGRDGNDSVMKAALAAVGFAYFLAPRGQWSLLFDSYKDLVGDQEPGEAFIHPATFPTPKWVEIYWSGFKSDPYTYADQE